MKSRYDSPIAWKLAGLSSTIISSAASRRRATVGAGATGVATITRVAPSADATRHAARTVDPVAIPSSTTIAVRPTSDTRARDPRIQMSAALELLPLVGLDLCERDGVDVRVAHDVVVDHTDTVLADRPHRELGLGREPDLADQDHVERYMQHDGHFVPDGDTSPGSASTTRSARADGSGKRSASRAARRRPASARSSNRTLIPPLGTASVFPGAPTPRQRRPSGQPASEGRLR